MRVHLAFIIRDLLHVSLGDFFWWAVPCYLCVIFAAFYGMTGISIKSDTKA